MEHVSSVRPTGKFPEKVENLKRWSRFPCWKFRTECRVPFTFLVVLYQFQVHGRAPPRTGRGLRPNGTTFCQSEIPLLLPPKFPGFFPKWKAPNIYISGKRAGWLSVRKLSPLPTPAKLVKLRKKNTVLRSPGVAMRKKVSYFHRSPVTRQSGRFEGRCSPMVLSQGPTL